MKKLSVELISLIIKVLVILYSILTRVNAPEPPEIPILYILILVVFVILLLQDIYSEYKISIENDTRVRKEKLLSRANIIASLLMLAIVIVYEIMTY